MRVLLLAAIAVVSWGAVRLPAAAADKPALRSEIAKIVDAHLAARAKPEHMSAISVSISLPGDPENLNVVAGRMSLDPASAPITPQTLFEIGSNTKAFTAAIVLQLEADRKLTLDETVGDRLPEYPAWRNVSIRQLLNMTSGIPDYLSVPGLLTVVAHNIHRRWTAEQLLAWVDPVYGHAPPSTVGWNYTNSGYLLAQLIVERIAGESYAAELASRFFGSRYGLENTFYSPNAYPQQVLDRMASGYFWNRDPGSEPLRPLLGADVKTADVSYAQAAGGIVSTPEDLTRFVRALYTGSLLEPKGRQELLNVVSVKTGIPIVTTVENGPAGFGLGVAQETRSALGTMWYYQGETFGYRMFYAYFPSDGIVVAIGLNSAPSESESKLGELLIKIYTAVKKGT